MRIPRGCGQGRLAPLIGITADWRVEGGRLRLSLPRDYVVWLASSGMRSCVLPSLPGTEDGILSGMDGLLLSGGADIRPELYGADPTPHAGDEYSHADRSAFEFALVWRALKLGIPILGICLGCQTLNASLGGTLVRHLEDPRFRHRRASQERSHPLHRIRAAPGSTVASLEPTRDMRVCSSHHQAVGNPAPGWKVTAWGPDGVVEAIENPAHPDVLGVQWHPERTPHSELSVRLAAWFRERASARRASGPAG